MFLKKYFQVKNSSAKKSRVFESFKVGQREGQWLLFHFVSVYWLCPVSLTLQVWSGLGQKVGLRARVFLRRDCRRYLALFHGLHRDSSATEELFRKMAAWLDSLHEHQHRKPTEGGPIWDRAATSCSRSSGIYDATHREWQREGWPIFSFF